MEFIRKEKNGVCYYVLDELLKNDFPHMFTTIKGGVSFMGNELNFGTSCGDTNENVLENFKRAFSCINSDCENAVRSKQTHSDIVLYADESLKGCGIIREQPFIEADGLMTDKKDLSLVIFYADCVPVIIADKKTRVVCAVHSGWRGTESKIVSKAIDKMCSLKGCNPKDMIVAIGPCIGVCHFEVDKNVYDIFINVYGEEFGKYENDKYFVDLGRIVARQAELAGVEKENIAFMDRCTYCDNELYSYRRQKERAGRMAAIIHS